MRDVMFRGKAKLSIEELDELEISHEDGWVFGNYIENGFFPYIVGDLADAGNDYIAHEWWVEVIPESVGQWTGLKDKNGVEIFEGDVVSTEDGCFGGTTCGIVTEYKGMFTSFYGQDALGREQYDELHTVSGEREVIGNIYQHPHLLEGATNGSS